MYEHFHIWKYYLWVCFYFEKFPENVYTWSRYYQSLIKIYNVIYNKVGLADTVWIIAALTFVNSHILFPLYFVELGKKDLIQINNYGT